MLRTCSRNRRKEKYHSVFLMCRNFQAHTVLYTQTQHTLHNRNAPASLATGGASKEQTEPEGVSRREAVSRAWKAALSLSTASISMAAVRTPPAKAGWLGLPFGGEEIPFLLSKIISVFGYSILVHILPSFPFPFFFFVSRLYIAYPVCCAFLHSLSPPFSEFFFFKGCFCFYFPWGMHTG